MRTYTYLLCDDGGVSNAERQEILIPLNTKFLHDFGLYKVTEYIDRNGNTTKTTAKIDRVICDRLKSNAELAAMKKH